MKNITIVIHMIVLLVSICGSKVLLTILWIPLSCMILDGMILYFRIVGSLIIIHLAELELGLRLHALVLLYFLHL